MSDYRVSLDIYSGPLDLLLFLIRRDEVDIYDIPIARVTEQYIEYLGLLSSIDPNAAGEFLVMATTLLEIKTRSLLPRPVFEDGEEEDLSDPRIELVRQLLEYKKFKDVAAELADSADRRSRQFARVPVLSDGRPADEVDLESVQIWDLLAAFHKLLAQTGRKTVAHEVVYDDTPMALHQADILDRLTREDGCMPFDRVFERRSQGEMIGLFLALLELIREKRVRIEQDVMFGQIYVFLRTEEEAQALREAEEEQIHEYHRLAAKAAAQFLEEAVAAPGQAEDPAEGADADGVEIPEVPEIDEIMLEVPDGSGTEPE